MGLAVPYTLSLVPVVELGISQFLHRYKGHLKLVSNHALANFSNADLTPATISLLSKGPLFVPTSKHIDWGTLSKDFLKFKNRMRCRAKYVNHEDDSDEELVCSFKLPSGNDASRSDGETLKLFLKFIENDIFILTWPKLSID